MRTIYSISQSFLRWEKTKKTKPNNNKLNKTNQTKILLEDSLHFSNKSTDLIKSLTSPWCWWCPPSSLTFITTHFEVYSIILSMHPKQLCSSFFLKEIQTGAIGRKESFPRTKTSPKASFYHYSSLSSSPYQPSLPPSHSCVSVATHTSGKEKAKCLEFSTAFSGKLQLL